MTFEEKQKLKELLKSVLGNVSVAEDVIDKKIEEYSFVDYQEFCEKLIFALYKVFGSDLDVFYKKLESVNGLSVDGLAVNGIILKTMFDNVIFISTTNNIIKHCF